jgi:N-acetylmuramoyl-L-alanine amidase
MRPLKEIIVHCTATRPEWMASKPLAQKMDEIRRWHVQGNGWSDIGYHYVIDRNGQIAEGRPVEKTGAHVKGRNTGSIGISLIGGHGGAETDKFSDHFTPAQDASARALISELQAKYGTLAVNGHNQFAAKACPCFQAPDWYAGGAVNRKYLPATAEAVVMDADKRATASTTNWAVLTGFAASGWQAWQSADVKVQLAALGVAAVLAYVMRERLRKAKLGKMAKEALGL